MKKAQLKQLREILNNLPNIPLLKDGKPVTLAVQATATSLIAKGFIKDQKNQPLDSGYCYTQQDEPQYVNKEQFFTSYAKAGKTVQQAIDDWNEKYKTVQKIIGSYVEPEKKPETEEERKRRVLEEHAKQERKTSH